MAVAVSAAHFAGGSSLVEHWGYFPIHKTLSNQGKHALQATCKYHRLNAKSGCKKRINVKSFAGESFIKGLKVLA